MSVLLVQLLSSIVLSVSVLSRNIQLLSGIIIALVDPAMHGKRMVEVFLLPGDTVAVRGTCFFLLGQKCELTLLCNFVHQCLVKQCQRVQQDLVQSQNLSIQETPI